MGLGCNNVGALTASITAAAIAISEGKTSEELALLGAILNQLGDTLATIGAQMDYIDANCKKNGTGNAQST